MQQPKKILERFVDVLSHVVALEQTPRQADLSLACPVAKANSIHKKGCSKFRLIHVLSPFWNDFYKMIYKNFFVQRRPVHAYGGIEGMRREEAIAVQEICSYRARRAGVSVASNFYDVSNAFWSVLTEKLCQLIDENCYGHIEKQLFKGHVRRAIFTLQCGDGEELFMLARCGVLQGGALGPLLFNHAY